MVAASQKCEVIITESVERAFFEILDYVFRHYTEERSEVLALELLNEPLRLRSFPEQGSLEPALRGQSSEYRFILFERHSRATVKIVYFVDKSQEKVFVTDFFPTEMHPLRVSGSTT